MTQPTTVVIDTDPGIDDAVALALAARSPELRVAAVTTTYGNAPLPATTRNARTVLDLAGRPDIPVWPGAARPLGRKPAYGATLHGPSGIGYAPVGPPAATSPDPAALLEALRAASGPSVLLTLGPLTNLALALERDQDAVRRAVTRHLAMLGNFGPAASPDRVADFNAWADPEAAQRVLSARLPTHLVPLDVTRQMVLSPDRVLALCRHGDKLSRWLGLALQFSVEANQRVRGVAGCTLHDSVVMGEILSPGILRFRERAVALDLDEGARRGHTRERPDGRPIPVAISVDLERMRALLQRLLPV